ncbi:ras protein [Mycena leptocephala]|nr:ras protein [Mycena leptocephala]
MDQWTVVVLGDGGVGKTAFAVQTYDPTIKDAYRKQFLIDQRMCFVEVIDTAVRVAEYATLRDQWVWEAQGFILAYSVASWSTFDRLEVFRQSVQQTKRGDAVMMVVGNQCDKVNDREFGCEFLETSAKTALNVERAFTSLIRILRENNHPEPGAAPNSERRREREKRKCINL